MRGHTFKQQLEMTEQRLNLRRVEPAKTVGDVESDLRAGRGHDRQAVLRASQRLHVGNTEIGTLLTRRRLNRIVLEDEQALEERHTLRRLAPTLHLCERRV